MNKCSRILFMAAFLILGACQKSSDRAAAPPPPSKPPATDRMTVLRARLAEYSQLLSSYQACRTANTNNSCQAQVDQLNGFSFQ